MVCRYCVSTYLATPGSISSLAHAGVLSIVEQKKSFRGAILVHYDVLHGRKQSDRKSSGPQDGSGRTRAPLFVGPVLRRPVTCVHGSQDVRASPSAPPVPELEEPRNSDVLHRPDAGLSLRFPVSTVPGVPLSL